MCEKESLYATFERRYPFQLKKVAPTFKDSFAADKTSQRGGQEASIARPTVGSN